MQQKNPAFSPQKKSAIEIISDLVAFPTVSGSSNADMMHYIRNFLEPLGFKVELIEKEPGLFNMVATTGPTDVPGIVLSGHSDVVGVNRSLWHSDPFRAEIRDGKLYGRGSVDMKGPMGTVLAALQSICEKPLKKPIHFVLSCDEETAGTGAYAITDYILKNFKKPEAAIIFEMTLAKEIGVAHKGVFLHQVKVLGKSFHSSRPDKGENAIIAASKIISFIEDMGKDWLKSPARHEGFEINYPTIGVGTISGGIAHNVIPDVCEFSWHVRPIEHSEGLEAGKKVGDFIKNHILPAYPLIKIEESVKVTAPLEPREKNRAAEIVATLIDHPVFSKGSGATDAGAFQKAGIDAAVFGPGDVLECHIDNEFISLEQIDKGLAAFEKLSLILNS